MDIIWHNRIRIKIAKYFFLIALIVTLASILLVLNHENEFFKKYDNKDNVSDVDQLKKTNTNDHKLSINKSLFEGIAEDLSPYKIFASKVDKLSSDTYKLDFIDAKCFFDQSSLSGIKINALAGIFNSSENSIFLEKNVVIKYENVAFNAKNLNIDFDKKDAYSNENIVVNYKNSQIMADKFETGNSVEVIKFNGNVRSKFMMSDFRNE